MRRHRSFLTLDANGVLLAIALGVMILFFGRNYGLIFLLELFLFLLLSALVTNFGRVKKEGIGVYEAARGWRNVLSNGSVPVMAAFVYFLNASFSFMPNSQLAMIYVAGVCAITADKFASEIGILNGYPLMLLTMKKVQKGVSGGVTLLGIGASLLGAAIIAASSLFLSVPLTYVIVACASGFIGNLVDSIFGFLEEQGIGNKYTSNFACALAASIVCLLILRSFP